MEKQWKGVVHYLRAEAPWKSIGKWVFRGAIFAIGAFGIYWAVSWYQLRINEAQSEAGRVCTYVLNRCEGGQIDPRLQDGKIECYCIQKEVSSPSKP